MQLTYFLIWKSRALALFSLIERSLTLYCQLKFVSIFTPRYLTLSLWYRWLVLWKFVYVLVRMRFSWQSNINKHVCEKSDTWRSFSYFNELQKEDKAKYKRELALTNGQLLPDPYGIVENCKSDAKLISDVSWGDMYNYVTNSPSEYTHNNLKA